MCFKAKAASLSMPTPLKRFCVTAQPAKPQEPTKPIILPGPARPLAAELRSKLIPVVSVRPTPIPGAPLLFSITLPGTGPAAQPVPEHLGRRLVEGAIATTGRTEPLDSPEFPALRVLQPRLAGRQPRFLARQIQIA